MTVDSVDAWMASANRYPLLSAAQEIHLSQLIRKALDSDHPSPSEQRAGRRAQNRLLQCNLRLVAKRVFSYRKMIEARHGTIEDALQEGTIGLNRACELFNPERGYKFSTYAVQWIDQGIRRYTQVCCDVIKKPASANDIHRRWKYRPTGQNLEDFCEEWNYNPEKVLADLQRFAETTTASLDQHVKQNDDLNELGDLQADPASELHLEDQDFAVEIEHLKADPATKDAIALIELAQGCQKISDLGVLLDCSTHQANKRVSDAKAVIREHLSEHIRDRIAPPEAKPVPLRLVEPAPKPVRQLVCAGVQEPSPEPVLMTQAPAMNGHQHADLERLVSEVQSEPQAKPQRAKRQRRTKAEIAAAKEPALITVIANGVELTAPPEVVASLVLQMSHAKAA